MNREMEHIDMLAGTIGFRVATTEGERRAGRYYEASSGQTRFSTPPHTAFALALVFDRYWLNDCWTLRTAQKERKARSFHTPHWWFCRRNDADSYITITCRATDPRFRW